jgi:hypothetical protein
MTPKMKIGLLGSVIVCCLRQGEIHAQTYEDNFAGIIKSIVQDPEISTWLFSYDYHGDYPLFIYYDSVVSNSIDPAAYNRNPNWRIGFDLKFQDRNIHVREPGFIFSERLAYYVKLISVKIDGDKALVCLTTNTFSGKQPGLRYFVAELNFRRQNGSWVLVKRKIEEKPKDSKW